METFLNQVAQDLYTRYGDHLNDIAVVFPNNRARIFFTEALYRQAGHPVWSPQFVDIKQLFASCSRWRTGDPLRLTGILYRCYQDIFNDNESFDEFYGWGQILLNDFDNIDKNLVDAGRLFRQIGEQAELEDGFEHLTDEQKEILQRFFEHVRLPQEGQSPLRENFVRLWNRMGQLYRNFREVLMREGEVYEGLLNRDVIERFDRIGQDAIKAKVCAFVGFNALNRCEEALFQKLQDAGKAIFYWDYDHFYMNPRHEAGKFLRRNLELFPNRFPESRFRNFSETPKNVRYISSSTENAQTHYASQWIREQIAAGHKPSEMVIVLCNESLLLPLLHCIPDDIAQLNVTMGYPMNQTPLFGLLRQLLLLHCDGQRDGQFRSQYVLPLLQNPYMKHLSPKADELIETIRRQHLFSVDGGSLCADGFLQCVFTPCTDALALGKLLLRTITALSSLDKEQLVSEDAVTFLPLYQESLFQAYRLLSQLDNLLGENLFEIGLATYRRLALKVLNISIPFSGEPLAGLQIMGILETRNLDFKHVLMLSANEGTIPQKTADSSFIPNNLRQAFGMTGQAHKDAISAYYFFRFIQRSEDLTFVYNSSTEGLSKGEMSRFLLQLEIEGPHPVRKSSVNAALKPGALPDLVFSKNAPDPDKPATLSPSAINEYFNCSLKYYFHHIRHLHAKEEPDGEIQANTFGSMFHNASQHIFTELMLVKKGLPHGMDDIEAYMESKQAIEVHVGENDLKPFLQKEYLETLVMRQFQKFVFSGGAQRRQDELDSQQKLLFKLLVKLLKQLIEMDMKYAPFTILGLEMEIRTAEPLEDSHGNRFHVRGYIDRIDMKGDLIRIMDYKTGTLHQVTASSKNIFESRSDKGYYLQTFLYSILYRRQRQAEGKEPVKIVPVLRFISNTASPGYSENIRTDTEGWYANSKKSQNLEDIADVEEDFMRDFCTTVSSIFNVSEPYMPSPKAGTDRNSPCQFCDYRIICGKYPDS